MISKAVVGAYFKFILFGFALFNIVVRVECGAASAGIDESLIILEQSTNFTTVLSLLRGTGIDLALEALEQATFLAPSDAAFRMLPSGELGTLRRDNLLDILRLHAVPAYLPISALKNTSTVTSFAGLPITFSRPSRSSLTVRCGSESADLVSSVFDRSPVAVYSIDRVLLPPALTPPISPDSALAPTIFDSGPSISASSPAPAPRAPSTSPGSAQAPAFSSTSAPGPSIWSPDSAPAPAISAPTPSITEVLENVSGFKTIESLLSATGLAEALESFPALTFLAPPDDAFLSLGKEALRNLSDGEMIVLLKYHALPAFFPGFEPGRPLRTLASGRATGFRLKIRPNDQLGRPGSATVDTGAEVAKIMGPLFIRSPKLAVYAVDKVLVPLELSASLDLRPITPAVAPDVAPVAPLDAAVSSSSSGAWRGGLAVVALALAVALI